MTSRHRIPAACSALALASIAAVCASSAGPVRLVAGLGLIGDLAFALWFMRRSRFDAVVPAAGLTLAFLILAGLALAAVHALSTVPVALVSAAATLAAAWVGARHPEPDPGPESDEPRARLKPSRPPALALAGALVFTAAAVLAVRYSADSAAADTDGATSVAIWAYPSGGRLLVGVEQPPGHGATMLRIVASQAGTVVATWNIALAPGQTWHAPALTVTGEGVVQIVALHGETVVASLSSR
ncbi:MAG TPA: hypothetical protein VGX23_28450 [Actinocrinis sp.]|nr:hypothetical protein [Actinocrinis sp.]